MRDCDQDRASETLWRLQVREREKRGQLGYQVYLYKLGEEAGVDSDFMIDIRQEVERRRLESPSINVPLHVSVVKGIVAIIKYLGALPEGQKVSLSTLGRIGNAHVGEAGQYVVEFIKDGIPNLRSEVYAQVAGGDYSHVWMITNRYLRRFGHPEIDPVPIDTDPATA